MANCTFAVSVVHAYNDMSCYPWHNIAVWSGSHLCNIKWLFSGVPSLAFCIIINHKHFARESKVTRSTFDLNCSQNMFRCR